jgi:hypothetical protein
MKEEVVKNPPGFVRKHPVTAILGNKSLSSNLIAGSIFNTLQNYKKIEVDAPENGKLGGLGPITTALLSLLTIPATFGAYEGYKAIKQKMYPNEEEGFSNMMENFPELKDEIDTEKLKKYYSSFHKLSPQLASHPAVAASFVRATGASGGGIDPGFAKAVLDNNSTISDPVTMALSNAMSLRPFKTIQEIDKRSSQLDLKKMYAKMKVLQKENAKAVGLRRNKKAIEIISNKLKKTQHGPLYRALAKLRGYTAE